MKKFEWMRAYFSPFKPPKIKFYVGKIAIGTPYFFPRKWVKYTKKEVFEKAQEKFDKSPENIKNDLYFNKLVDYYTGMEHAVSKKIGFDFVSLGWKTKWDDYRFEWNPVWSFVFFKWQIAVVFVPNNCSHYWESWLYYTYNTDKNLSKEERILLCMEKAPQIWISHKDGQQIRTNYYTKILKKKYLNLIKQDI